MPELHTDETADIRALLRQVIEHFEHTLPGQAAIKDFVHHNTLHGFQHLPFPRALAAAHKVTGSYGYLPEEAFRRYFHDGRITAADLDQILRHDLEFDSEEILITADGESLYPRDIIRTALVYPLKAVTSCQLNWQIEEFDALAAFQPDVNEASRSR